MPILCALNLRSSGSVWRPFRFGARFTPICSAVSVHVFRLGAKVNLLGKALKPCIDAIAASKLYLAERSTSTVAGDGSDGPGCCRVAHVLDNSVISFVNLSMCCWVEMSWGSLET